MTMTDKKRILFVDDDPAVLAALSNVLRRERHRWEMVFATGGEQALAEIDKGAFDVVVSDMRMPDMSGDLLLEMVRRASPQTYRIILSGSECGTSLPNVDELLSKPCSARTLKETLERVMARGR
jgi:DNA-binding NtrC family response regulator